MKTPEREIWKKKLSCASDKRHLLPNRTPCLPPPTASPGMRQQVSVAVKTRCSPSPMQGGRMCAKLRPFSGSGLAGRSASRNAPEPGSGPEAPLQSPFWVCLSCQCPAYTGALGSATGMDASIPGQQREREAAQSLGAPSRFEQAGL